MSRRHPSVVAEPVALYGITNIDDDYSFAAKVSTCRADLR
jgi:hypothetical protein